jgi:putative ABC transport system permease protein
MSSGLTRQALRRHRWGFAGPFATQCVAAAVITAMITTGASMSAATLSAAERRALDESDMADAAAAFVGSSIYLSILMVGVTMTAAIARQTRDIALVRAVGATPGRVRRSVARQAALVAVPAAALGYGLGLAFGRVWLAQLASHDVVPAGVTFRPLWWVLPLVIGIEVVTSVVGALVSAIRPARVRPATALTETATQRPAGGMVRTVLGTVLLLGGVVLSAALTRVDAEQADAGGLFVILGMSVGVGLLGPVLLRVTARVARPVLRLAGNTGLVAAEAMVARSRALSTALVPLVLAGGFAGVKIGTYGTAEHATGVRPPAADLWLEYSGTAIFVAFAVIGAVNTLLTVSVGRERELALMRLAGATRARVLAVWSCEAGLVLGAVVVLAAGVALATLVPMTHTAFGSLPYVPPGQLVLGVLAAAAVVGAGTVLPAAVLTRRPPIESVRVTM